MDRTERIDHNGNRITENEFGYLHSFDDQPAIIYVDGSMGWHKNGELHRENDLPAVVRCDGMRAWWINGRRHRLYAPARVVLMVSEEWYIRGQRITSDVGEWISENEINPDWKEWTDADKVLFKLRFG